MAEHNTIDDILNEGRRGQFESRPTYSASGDCVELFFEDADYFAERVDCWLTVYKRFGDEHIVGFQIKNVATLLSRFDALGLDCRIKGTKWAIRLDTFVACVPFVDPESSMRPAFRDIFRETISRENHAFELTPMACGT
jgi:hypothetical protein